MLFLEIGGGENRKSQEWTNIDICDSADIRHDLSEYPWPLEDDSVDGVYSSHCLEHLEDIHSAIIEIARISKVGANVEIRLPHWLHDCAMGGLAMGYKAHMHSYGPQFWWRICNERGCQKYWPNSPKRLFMERVHYEPESTFEEAQAMFPQMSSDQIMRIIPGTCHEVRYYFTVIPVEEEKYTERAT